MMKLPTLIIIFLKFTPFSDGSFNSSKNNNKLTKFLRKINLIKFSKNNSIYFVNFVEEKSTQLSIKHRMVKINFWNKSHIKMLPIKIQFNKNYNLEIAMIRFLSPLTPQKNIDGFVNGETSIFLKRKFMAGMFV